MQIDGALVREQGITFAVVAVKKHVVDNRAQALSAARSFAPLFQNVPIVLMGQDSTGRATFFGRQDMSDSFRASRSTVCRGSVTPSEERRWPGSADLCRWATDNRLVQEE